MVVGTKWNFIFHGYDHLRLPLGTQLEVSGHYIGGEWFEAKVIHVPPSSTFAPVISIKVPKGTVVKVEEADV